MDDTFVACPLLSKLANEGVLDVNPFMLSQARLFFWNAVMFMILLFTNAKVSVNLYMYFTCMCEFVSVHLYMYVACVCEFVSQYQTTR